MTETFVNILLVEDDEDDYLLTRELLSQALGGRHQLDWIADFEQAAAAIAAARHDVYLVDYRLGAREGLDLIPGSGSNGSHAPFIMLTGHGHRETDLQAMERGAADYLLKGALTSQSLERAIRYALARAGAETALRKSEQQQRLILDNIDEAIYLISRDANGRWERCPSFMSGAIERLLGRTEQEFLSDPEALVGIIHPEDEADMKLKLAERLVSGGGSTLQYRAIHKQTGQIMWIEDTVVPQRDDNHEITALIGILRDITQRKALQDKLVQAAFHDSLTGLPNRSLFMDRLANAIGRGKRSGNQHWAVLFIDLNRFKSINDNLGHDVGDKVLISTAQRIKNCLRAGDTLARLGGDEFIALLDDISSADDAYRVSMRIHEALSPPHAIEGREVSCTASIGIAHGKPDYQQPEEVLRNADTAMYRAKADGGTRAELFRTGMHMRLDATFRKGHKQVTLAPRAEDEPHAGADAATDFRTR